MSRGGERERFLRAFGERVRGVRARRGMSRKLLARHSRVSERYLTQLESGKANISVLLLRRIAMALALPPGSLFEDESTAAEMALLRQFLSRLSPSQLRQAYAALATLFADGMAFARSRRIALVGLRGAGKTTLGRTIAGKLQVPFFELDREVERLSGVALEHLLELYGQTAFRRYEMQALQELLCNEPAFVVATGGSIVSETATYELLLRSCFTVWLRTTPEEHMARVIAQGDQRPIAASTQAMADLRRILEEREPLYARADVTVDTTAGPREQSVAEVLRTLPLPAAQ